MISLTDRYLNSDAVDNSIVDGAVCVSVAYEYVADSEEASLSQCESIRSLCSVDDVDFRSKTQQFFDGMARLRQEIEAEQIVEQQKTHTVSRSFYPRRVSDNVTYQTNMMMKITSPSEQKLEPSGAELYRSFSNKLFVPSLTVERRRSAGAAGDGRISHELDQFLRPHVTKRSWSVTSTPSNLQRPSSRQSESEESISMVDVTWQHRKPSARKHRRPRPKLWEETEAETLSVVRTRRLKQEKEKEMEKRQEIVQLRQKERTRRDEFTKQLEMVEQQERKIKEELAKQQKVLQQLTAERQHEIERERIQDVARQQELMKEQQIIRKQELRRLSEIQEQHELAKKLALQQRQMEIERALQAEKVKDKVETQEVSFISIDVSAPVATVKSAVQESVEHAAVSVETIKLPGVEDGNIMKSHKLEMVGERPVTPLPPLAAVESLTAAKMRNIHSCGVSTFADELPNLFSFSNPLHEKVAAVRTTLESPDAVRCVNVRAVSPLTETPSLPVLEVVDATVSVAKEMIHSEQVTDILTAEDLHIVELVEKSFEAKPAVRHSQSSEDEVFYDASDVDVHSVASDVAAEAGELMPTGSLLMAPVFELPLADVTAFDGAGAILECRVTGNPTPEVMWFVNGVEIRSMPPEVTVSYHASLCRLVIVDVMPDDEGEYTVRAINEAGSCITSAYLTVLRMLTCTC